MHTALLLFAIYFILLFRYLKFHKVLKCHNEKDIDALPWEQTFERFLLSHPTSKEDCDLFVDVLIFLQLYLNVIKNGKINIEYSKLLPF